MKENDRKRESGGDGDAPRLRSAIRPEDWLPVQEMLLRGLNHSLSNRLASLSALAILLEGSGRPDARMQEALSSDAERLGDLLELFRALPGSANVRREATQIGDALKRAGTLIEHHPECRDITIAPIIDASDAPPVTLLSTDALRASVLMMLAVVRGTPPSPTPLITTTRAGADGFLHVTMELAGASCERIATSAEFVALERFAKAEGGRVHCATGDAEGTGRLTMALPGLGVTRGR